MKLVPGLIAGFALAVAPATRAADYQLVTRCKALLAVISADPADKGITLESASQPFAPTVAGFGRSQVVLTVGDYTVRGSMQMNSPVGIPLSVTSMAFISAQVDGKNVSRIDFSCSVTKIK